VLDDVNEVRGPSAARTRALERRADDPARAAQVDDDELDRAIITYAEHDVVPFQICVRTSHVVERSDSRTKARGVHD
jgi:hypothetical protein